jgi:hypothetical protein
VGNNFKIGDRVSWNSEAGRVSGTVPETGRDELSIPHHFRPTKVRIYLKGLSLCGAALCEDSLHHSFVTSTKSSKSVLVFFGLALSSGCLELEMLVSSEKIYHVKPMQHKNKNSEHNGVNTSSLEPAKIYIDSAPSHRCDNRSKSS